MCINKHALSLKDLPVCIAKKVIIIKILHARVSM